MKIVIDAHMHTIASGHAYSTVLETISRAGELGLELIAITDHAPAMPGSSHEIYFSNFASVPKEVNGVKLMLGVELNILDKTGAIDLTERTLSRVSPVIASFHTPCYKFSKDEMTDEEKKAEITGAIMNIMENKYINILGHPGDPHYPFDIFQVVEKSIETGTLLEINNASLNKNSFRYGSRDTMLELLKLCKKADCPVVLGSDAHFASVCGEFEDTLELLAEADFPEKLIANLSVERFLSLLSVKEGGGSFRRCPH